MPTYEKFMKELLSRKKKFKEDENIVLGVHAITQRKLPPNLTYHGRFTIPYAIGPSTIRQALCNLRAIIHDKEVKLRGTKTNPYDFDTCREINHLLVWCI